MAAVGRQDQSHTQLRQQRISGPNTSLKPRIILQNSSPTDIHIQDECSTYLPRFDIPQIVPCPPDISPLHVQYEIVDRVPGSERVPEYILREVSASTQIATSLVEAQTATGVVHDYCKDDRGKSSADGASSTSSLTRKPIMDAKLDENYERNNRSTLHVSLFDIDAYVSPREIELFENSRYANPRPEDFPYKTPTPVSSSRSSVFVSGRHQRRLGESKLVLQKRPVGRPPKKRKMTEAIVMIPTRRNQHSDSLVSFTQDIEMSGGSVADVESLADDTVSMREQHEEVPMIESTESDNHEDDTARVVLPVASSPGQRRRSSTSHSSSTASRSRASADPIITISRRKHSNSPSVELQDLTTSPTLQFRTRSRRSHLSSTTDASSSHAPKRTTRKRHRRKSESQINNPLNHNTGERSPGSGLVLHSPGRPSAPHTQKGMVEASALANDEYEISHIITHNDNTGIRFYLVRWVGYSAEEATWLDEDELQDAQEVVQEYLKNIERAGSDAGSPFRQ